MSNLSYPTRQLIEKWLVILKNENLELTLKLPQTSEQWFDRVLSNVELTRIAYCEEDVFVKGAHLFYYITKDHNFTDGNKRSAIVVTYLYFLINTYFIGNPEKVRLLAKRVAKSKGSKMKDSWIKKIEKEFRSTTHLVGTNVFD